MIEDDIESRYNAVSELANEIVRQFHIVVTGEGFEPGSVDFQSACNANYRLEKDPSNGQYSLVGDWLNDRGHKQGSIMFRHDGSFFAEYDVVQPHPLKKSWFVEAVDAWGNPDEIKAEARLLRAV